MRAGFPASHPVRLRSMSDKAAITINLPREEVERRWRSSAPEIDGDVTFKDAPGDRGTEIHVALASGGGPIDKLKGTVPLAKAKDQLRRFKQQAETGEIPRSDGTPEGEKVERKLKQRPAQPLSESELEKAGV